MPKSDEKISALVVPLQAPGKGTSGTPLMPFQHQELNFAYFYCRCLPQSQVPTTPTSHTGGQDFTCRDFSKCRRLFRR